MKQSSYTHVTYHVVGVDIAESLSTVFNHTLHRCRLLCYLFDAYTSHKPVKHTFFKNAQHIFKKPCIGSQPNISPVMQHQSDIC